MADEHTPLEYALTQDLANCTTQVLKQKELIEELAAALDVAYVVLKRSSVTLSADPNPIPLIEAVMKKAKELGYV